MAGQDAQLISLKESKGRGRKRGLAMTDEHKAALAVGRDEARLVKAYLEALSSVAPRKRGRRRTEESIRRRLATIADTVGDASPLARLKLIQEKADLEQELLAKDSSDTADLEAARVGFIKVAKSYANRKGITYATWRAVGVDAETLKAAGISRT